MVAGVQLTLTELMLDEVEDDDEEDCTVSDSKPLTDVFWTLVAVMVTVPAEAGAVKSPFELIDPELADHLTAGL